MKYVLSLISLLFLLNTNGQLNTNFNQYMLHQNATNPAFIDINTWYSASVVMRRQWMSMDEGPITYMAHGHYTFDRNNAAALMVTSDKTNDVSRTEFAANYAYRVWFGTRMAMGLGIKAGYQQTSVGGDYVYFSSGPDPTLSKLKYGGLSLGTGISLQSKNFDAGISLPSLFNNAITQPLRDNLPAFNHIYATLGYKFRFDDMVVLYPTLLVKAVEGTAPSFSFDTHLLYNQFLWVGAGYDSDNTLSTSLGVFFDKGFRIVYSFESSWLTRHERLESSHEVSIILARPHILNPFSERTYRSKRGGAKRKPVKRK